MKKLPLLAATACLVLAGCFQSQSLLLDISKDMHPLAAGTWTSGDGDDKSSFTMTTQQVGYLKVEGDSRQDVVLTPLAGHADTYAAAEADAGCASHPADCKWEYAVVVVLDGQSEAREIAPSCEKDWAKISADVASRNDSGDTCWFQSASGLEHALGVVADGNGNSMSFRRE